MGSCGLYGDYTAAFTPGWNISDILIFLSWAQHAWDRRLQNSQLSRCSPGSGAQRWEDMGKSPTSVRKFCNSEYFNGCCVNNFIGNLIQLMQPKHGSWVKSTVNGFSTMRVVTINSFPLSVCPTHLHQKLDDCSANSVIQPTTVTASYSVQDSNPTTMRFWDGNSPNTMMVLSGMLMQSEYWHPLNKNIGLKTRRFMAKWSTFKRRRRSQSNPSLPSRTEMRMSVTRDGFSIKWYENAQNQRWHIGEVDD